MKLGPYISAFAVQARVDLRHRLGILAGLVAQLWFGVVSLMAYAAVYHHATGVAAPLSLRQAMTYTWVLQSLFRLLPTSALPMVGQGARSGAIVYDLLRPLDLWGWWYSASLAWLVGAVVPRAVLLVLVAGPVARLCGLSQWALALPQCWLDGVFALVSLALGALVAAAIVMIWNVMTLRALSPMGANAIAVPLSVLLSGMLLPLPLYPHAIAGWMLWQPFAAIADIPIRLYLGVNAPYGRFGLLGLQCGWLVALVVMSRLWLARAVRRLEVQGA